MKNFCLSIFAKLFFAKLFSTRWNPIPSASVIIFTLLPSYADANSGFAIITSDGSFCGGSASGTCSHFNGIINPLGWPQNNVYCHISSAIKNISSCTKSCTSTSTFLTDNGTCTNPKNAGTPPSGCCAGNPINVGAGNKFQEETDYRNSSSTFQFSRAFNSNLSRPSHFGTGWIGRYDQSITIVSTTPAIASAMRSDGKVYSFTVTNNVGIPDADVPDHLVQLTDGSGKVTGWRYTRAADDSIENYSAAGQLLSIVSRSGQIQTLTYSDANTPSSTAPVPGLLIRIADSFNRNLNFTYDSASRVVTMSDPAGGVHLYSYGSYNKLMSVTYPDGKTRTYVYNEYVNTSGTNSPNALTGIIDENGNRFATWKYDTLGRAISSEHDIKAGSTVTPVEKVSIAYTTDTNGNVTSSTLTDALNTTRAYAFTTVLGTTKNNSIQQPCVPGCGTVYQTNSYDANGNVARKIDFNGTTTNYIYDLTRNLETSRTEAYGTPQARTITTTWHATYRLPTQINEPGKRTDFSYDANGNLLSKTITDTALNTSRTWAYTYNALGQVLTTDGPRTDVADVTTNTYYATTSAGNYTMGDLATVTNALGQVTAITKYDANGRPLSITDANGVITTLTYSPRGWLTSRTVNGTQTTTYAYDGVGQLTKITQPDGSYLSYTYDTAHRLTDITDSTGNKIHYTLDAMSNRTKEETFDPSNALKKSRSKVYDALNRLQKDIGGTNPTMQITQYSYDNNGNLKTTTDPLSRVTSSNYDALNRLVQITDPNSGIAQKGYNSLDQVSSVTDPRSLITQYTNDALGNLKQLQSPDSGTTTNVYDASGNVTQKTDARGVVTQYSYDALNRITAITYPASSAENIAFTYDNTTSGNKGKGRLTGYSTASSATSFFYDSYGNVTQQSDLLSPSIYTTGYQYNSANRVTQITYPSGRIVTYTRNSLGQITQVQTQVDSNASPVTIIGNASYLPFGPINSMTFGNGVVTSLTYDLDYRVSRITVSSNPVWDFGYSYDAASHITGITDQIGSRSKTYGYDALYRVTSDTNPAGTWNYAFDANSNRTGYTWWKPDTTITTQTATISATSNRLTQLNGGSVATDSAGNLLTKGNSAYTYNNANRLSSYSESGVLKATYGYNAQNQRTVKQATRLTHYHYALDGKTLATTEYNTDGSLYQRIEYLWLDDMPVAQIRMDYVNNAVSATRLTYIHVDHLNTPRAMTDSTQTVVWRWDSDAFGFVPPNNDPDGNLQTDNLALRFPGQLLDADNGLSINGFREYDPSLGRYALQSDPIGLEGGSWSTYGYVNGQPVSNIDPLGLYHYNAPAPRTVPVRGQTAQALQCTETCLRGSSDNQNLDLLITGGAEPTGHTRNSHHSRGEACDIAGPRFNHVDDEDVRACAQRCGFGAGQFETFPNNPNRNHWHLQITPGNGVPAL